MDTTNSSDHQPIEAPSGLDLHPQPEKAKRISRRAGIAIASVGLLLLVAFAYGGLRRTLNNQTAARDAGFPRASLRRPRRARSSCRQLRLARYRWPCVIPAPAVSANDHGSLRRRSEDGPAVPLQSTNRSAL